MTETANAAPKAKGKKNQPPKPTPTQLAFRAYARVSYYLATQGDFDFSTDDLAHKYLDEHHSTSGMPDRVKEISFLTDQRSTGITIPKGDFINGLAIRTDRRMLMEKSIAASKKGKKA